MYINNKTNVSAGVNFLERSNGDQLTINLAPADGETIKGGDLVVIKKDSANQLKAFKVTPADTVGMAEAGRNFLYICWQGSEEPYSIGLEPNYMFIKLRDVIATFHVSSDTYSSSSIGDHLVIDDGTTTKDVEDIKIMSKNTMTDTNGQPMYLLQVLA